MNFLGGQLISALHAQGMRAIVSLTEYPLTVQRDVPPDVFTRFDLVYLHSPIKDQYAPDIAQAEAVIRHIDQMNEQKRPVLVHCYAGSGRTGTILHAYYLAHGLNLDEAKAQVRSRRF
ncbi:MAG TPA: dual specificity protein phosphatase family protein, partial [Aggregatilineaceae bacterium]|nr:dual specificity protein phosphatase family protein [Aggregatilineaceae bacterium]